MFLTAIKHTDNKQKIIKQRKTHAQKNKQTTATTQNNNKGTQITSKNKQNNKAHTIKYKIREKQKAVFKNDGK